MPGEKKTGEVHLPEIERDLPVQGGSEDGEPAHRPEGTHGQGVRKAGILTDGESQEQPADRPTREQDR